MIKNYKNVTLLDAPTRDSDLGSLKDFEGNVLYPVTLLSNILTDNHLPYVPPKGISRTCESIPIAMENDGTLWVNFIDTHKVSSIDSTFELSFNCVTKETIDEIINGHILADIEIINFKYIKINSEVGSVLGMLNKQDTIEFIYITEALEIKKYSLQKITELTDELI